MNDPQKTSLESPPPYSQSSCSPLVLAATTTTRTEVVTTTTTETTTHFFSLPHFRKRAGPSQQSTKDDCSNPKLSTTSLPSDIALLEKALPPTPPNEIDGSQNDSAIMSSTTQGLATSSPITKRATDAVHFATSSPQTHSRAALTHAALGKGLPHTLPTTTPHLETNTIPFVSSASSIPVLTRTIRKSRSFHWLKRNVSENYGPSNDDRSNHPVSERHRGLSFDANSSLSISVTGDYDKGKPTELSFVGPKAAAKTVSRRASFWSKRRGSPEHPSRNEIVLTVPSLPPVHHASPSNISHSAEALSSPIPTIHTAPFSDPFCNAEPHETVTPLPRPRAQTNPPFLRRLSMGVFFALDSSSPIDLHESNPTHFPAVPPTVAPQAVHKPVIPKPLSKEESPDIYLTRLQSAVNKAEVAGILASRYVVCTSYLHYIHSRTVRIHFTLRPFDHMLANLTFLAFPLTLHCGNCLWKWAFPAKPNKLIEL
jgi:hypothetical protein